MSDSHIVVDGVSKQFRLKNDRAASVKELFTRRDRDRAEKRFWALRDVSFEIAQGSMFALVGHNGCGKSTLLRCINGLASFDAGRIRVAEHVLHGGNGADRAASGAGTWRQLGAALPRPDLNPEQPCYMGQRPHILTANGGPCLLAVSGDSHCLMPFSAGSNRASIRSLPKSPASRRRA